MQLNIKPFLLFFLFCLTCFSQSRQQELDSLIQRADHLPDNIEKAQVLSRIHERMMFMDNERALLFAREAFDLANRINYEKGVANGYLQFGNYYYNQSKNDSASFFHHKALNAFKDMKSVKGQIFALHSLATIQREAGDFDKAIETTQSILQMYTEENRSNSDLGNFDLRGSEYEVLGGIYFEKGNYLIALQETLKALRFFEDKGDEVRKADALKQLADIEFQQENYASSLNYAMKAIAIYKENDDKIYASYALNTAGLASEKLGNTKKSKNLLEESLELAKEMNVQTMMATSLKDLGRLVYKEGNYESARSLLVESIEIAQKEDIKLNLTAALHEMANLKMFEEEYQSALTDINEVIAISEEIEVLPTLRDALKTKAELQKLMGNTNDAYTNFSRYAIINDSLYSNRKAQQIAELKTIYETEKKEAALALQEEEIAVLNEKAKVDKLTKGLYAGGMAAFILVSGLLYFGFRQRIKKNRIAREKQEAIYQQEIEHKQKELASQTLHLVQKNTFIQELMENLENVKNSPDRFKTEFRRMVMLLKKENASDKDWEVFKTYFSEVHNDFDQKLKTIYADISEKEIRLAAFLRMNLTTKEIAATLNVLPDSILKSKYRLKKKLGLGKEQDLMIFLNNL
ncbi:tetratricopeptide repeat protein [Cytophaga sp. FL35]|uniref:tetratricopeptide repeat protein n=1 Tax=Cytophaga sp. FL35 TaxID=1904456 RepID=UPI0016534AB2|nr:tetratricopeptide repeat protein [Cytophaga sp. FL35]MBC6998387.1 tetratricopeptide repeat protein [Cytophaga sp. FL35]